MKGFRVSAPTRWLITFLLCRFAWLQRQYKPCQAWLERRELESVKA